MRNLRSLQVLAGILLLIIVPNIQAQESATELSRVSATRDLYPDWSPDGNTIVFNSDRRKGTGNGFDLYTINSEGSGLTQITDTAESEEAPIWSPDGKRILYSSYLTEDNSELFLINPDGSGKKRVTNSPKQDGHAKFAPDGKSIVFNSRRDEQDGYELYEMNLATSAITRLTEFDGWDTYPDISPDGSKIVWRRILASGGSSRSGRNSEVFVMNRDGTNPVNISNHEDFDGYPAWSPDGSKIVFASNRGKTGDDRGNFHIYIMNPDGSNVQKLLNNGKSIEDARPRWSPDGRRILFNRQYVADKSSIDILIYELAENDQIK